MNATTIAGYVISTNVDFICNLIIEKVNKHVKDKKNIEFNISSVLSIQCV
jgi:hypothetical protein